MAPGAGARPQTRAFPGTNSAAFRNAMADLWLAVTTGNPRFGLPAFFPEAAYKQVKASRIPPRTGRTGSGTTSPSTSARPTAWWARSARLVRVIVPASDAAWVYPGACYNTIGYWHVPGARVVYREHGQERSFGIASLISWRGVWYVVHFGAVLRHRGDRNRRSARRRPGRPGPAGRLLTRIGQAPCAQYRAASMRAINCAQSRRWLARFREV